MAHFLPAFPIAIGTGTKNVTNNLPLLSVSGLGFLNCLEIEKLSCLDFVEL